MVDNVLVVMLITGFFLGLGLVVSAILNVREHIARQRRITREYKDQKQWERFYENGKEIG